MALLCLCFYLASSIKAWKKVDIIEEVNLDEERRTGRGRGGGQFRKKLKFFGQNAHDSGKSSWNE